MCQGLQHCPRWEPKAAGLFGAGGWWEEPRPLGRALAKAAAQPRWLSAGWRECTAGQGGLELCLYSSVCFINKSNHIQSRQDEPCRFLECPRSGTEAAREGLMPGAQEQGAQGSPTMGDGRELSAWPQPGISSCPSELHPLQAKSCPQHPTIHHQGEIWGWGWRGQDCPAAARSRGHRGCPRDSGWGQRWGRRRAGRTAPRSSPR